MTRSQHATERFGSRAAAYARSRPGYPQALFDFLQLELGMKSGHRAVELGAGTGIFARYLLDRGLCVTAVEPNDAMRKSAEANLGGQNRFCSVDTTAEYTGLPDRCCEWVFAAQAFHWFDADLVANEVRRLLRPGGRCVLVWNQRLLDKTPFLRDYEAFLRSWGIDYASVAESYEHPESIRQVLGGNYGAESFENHQDLDLADLEARVFSSSYMPDVESERADDVRKALRDVYYNHAKNGLVRIDYATNAYWSQLNR